MSWQEKIDGYKKEERQKQEEIIKLKGEEKLRIAKERIPCLADIIKQLRCEECLTEVRDELWKLGEISIFPSDIKNLTPETSIEAGVTLEAKWPYFSPGYEDDTDYYEMHPPWVEHHEIAISTETLSIWAIYGKILYNLNGEPYIYHDAPDSEREIILIVGNKELTFLKRDFTKVDSIEKTSQWLERILIEDHVNREDSLPYDARKIKNEHELVQILIKEELKPPEGFEYLLELAKKARLEKK